MDDFMTMTYERTGRIARITLNRPERGNGITLAMPRNRRRLGAACASEPAYSAPACTSFAICAVNRAAPRALR